METSTLHAELLLVCRRRWEVQFRGILLAKLGFIPFYHYALLLGRVLKHGLLSFINLTLCRGILRFMLTNPFDWLDGPISRKKAIVAEDCLVHRAVNKVSIISRGELTN